MRERKYPSGSCRDDQLLEVGSGDGLGVLRGRPTADERIQVVGRRQRPP
jgi:hypothetical protein